MVAGPILLFDPVLASSDSYARSGQGRTAVVDATATGVIVRTMKETPYLWRFEDLADPALLHRCRARSVGTVRPRPSERGERQAKPSFGEALHAGAGNRPQPIHRGEFVLCDPCRSGNHRRISAPDMCRPSASVLAASSSEARVRAEAGFPPRAVGLGRTVPALRRSGSGAREPVTRGQIGPCGEPVASTMRTPLIRSPQTV